MPTRDDEAPKASAETEKASAETEKPSAKSGKPSAETEKPSAETEKPSAETEKPSAQQETSPRGDEPSPPPVPPSRASLGFGHYEDITADRTVLSVASVDTVPAPPLPKEATTGDLLGGKYLLVKLIGSGGMGKVFEATHTELDARVAVKLMHSYIVGLPENSQRFRREARAAARINHPNVVRVIDFGVEGESHYIVMEYLSGVGLDDWLDHQEAPPPFEIVVPILLQILDALGAAHDAGVIHRDLKPDNVILTESAVGAPLVKITDFGLAHYTDPADNGITFTKDDAIAGTPGYMSPEQCRSLKVGASTDLYAFGCLLTELLQLHPPFVAATAMDVITQQLFVPAGPLVRPVGTQPVPELLEELRLALLEKSPHRRPSSVAEVRERLLTAMDPEAAAARLPGRKGDVPLGGRGDRIPAWNRAPMDASRNPTQQLPDVSRVLVESGAGGLDSFTLTGLAMQGIRVGVVVALDQAGAPVILIEGGSSTAETLELLRSMQDRCTTQVVVVCLENPSQATINELIALGAREIVSLPTSAAVLGPRLQRAMKTALRLKKTTE